MAGRLTRLLLDTSVVIAGLPTLKLDAHDAAAISVITLGELQAGVRLAGDPNTHAVRQARLAAVRQTFEPIGIDEAVAHEYGELLATARKRKRVSKATDLLILATAAATGRALLTLDDGQAGLARLAGVPVRRREASSS